MMKSLLMITLFAVASLVSAQSVLEQVKQAAIDEGLDYKDNIGVVSDNPLQIDAMFKGGNRSLEVEANPLRTQAAKETMLHHWLYDIQEAPGPGERTLFGWSLGEHCIYSEGPTYLSEWALGDRYVVSVDVSMKRVGTPQEIEARHASIKRLCDRIARRTLAEAMATDLNDDGSLRGTAHLTGAEVNKQGMVPLAAWAQNRGITVTYDNPSETASFTYHGHAVSLHLASGDAVVSAHPISLNGKFIMARGTRWFVPGAELDAAIG